MRKRVLLAEESDAIRGVAETLLRQNGFEVISVKSGERAQEVIEQTRPDLMVLGGDLLSASGQPLYEVLQIEERVSGIPVLYFNDPQDKSLPFPEEVIIARPFQPAEFVEKVMIFSGQSETAAPQAPPVDNPLGDSGLDDDLLDAALGLDQIDVTESEVMDKTTGVHSRKKASASEDFVGMQGHSDQTNQTGGTKKVESVMIKEGQSDAAGDKTSGESERIGTQKLDLLNDILPNQSEPDREHDYEWFINEMQQDVQSIDEGKAAPASVSPPPAPAHEPPAENESLEFSDPSSSLDPVTPPPDAQKPAPSQKSPAGTPAHGKPGGQGSSTGVEKFIDEFKKEIEKFQGDELDQVEEKPESAGPASAQSSEMQWEESLEEVTPRQVAVFTQQFATALADKLAERIAAKIDSDRLLTLLKREIVKQVQSRNK